MNVSASDTQFKCPVCRARQVLQSPCRRCDADLSLVVAAHRRIAYLRSELENAESILLRQQIGSELQRLKPN